MTDIQSSASSRVFYTPELFELIFSHLELLEILRLQAVDQHFLFTITNSPVLQRRTFRLRPRNVDGSVPCFFDTKFRGHHYNAILRAGPFSPNDHPSAAPKSDVPSHIDASLFNPVLDRVFCGLRIQHLEYGWTLFTFTDFTSCPPVSHSTGPVRPSWTDMLLTAVPLRRLRLEPAKQLRGSSFISRTPHLPANGHSGWIAPPDAAEERRIAALYARMSMNVAAAHRISANRRGDGTGEANRRRFVLSAAPRARALDEDLVAPAPLPLVTALRWAAARGEASNEGWVWGSSLQFTGGRKPFPGYATALDGGEGGVTVGQVVEEMRGSKWNAWVIRQVVD